MEVTALEAIQRTAARLVGSGLRADLSQEVARSLVVADLWGVHSHGLMRVPHYLRRLAAGGYSGTGAATIASDTGPLVVLDGHGGLGHPHMAQAARFASERASVWGVGLVAVQDSGHCGALGVAAADIALAGYVGVALSHGPAAIAPAGSAVPVLSTSPMALAVGDEEAGMVVDLSLSATARGTIAEYAAHGRPLPEGWAFDSSGQPTRDAHEALTGALAPLGGSKGFALAMLVESLTGVLLGTRISPDVPDMFDPATDQVPQQVGHLVLALRPAAISPGNAEASRRRMVRLFELVEHAGGRVPGRRKLDLLRQLSRARVDVDDVVWASLEVGP